MYKRQVKGKSDDEIKKLLIRTVKEGDPARIAALLVAPYYMESAITQSARLTPVVKAMRLQDQNQENRYIQPTNLSFMGFPNTILIPLQPHPDGLIPRTIYALKSGVPGITVMTDVALDPYNSDGHDGLVEFRSDGTMEILNDDSVEVLCRQALCHADAGADIISPSDMMDGRVAAIRATLDSEALDDVSIMAYTAKYASALYGPFRGALESAPKEGDKKTYQMDPGNIREALREAQLDEAEGADILMVKPATLYLDVIAAMRRHVTLPVAAYHVSGEYLMIKSAASSGWLDEREAVLETLTCIRRAGADMILTYYAPQAAEWLKQQR